MFIHLKKDNASKTKLAGRVFANIILSHKANGIALQK